MSCKYYFCCGLTSISVALGNTVYDSRNNSNAIIETNTNTLIVGCKNTTIPEGVTSIGDGAFVDCVGLTSITITEGVTKIGKDAFFRCDGLTAVTIPSSVTNIGDGAFSSCEGLTSVTILDGVTSIGDGAFRFCDGLTSVTIPGSVTSIGDDAFGSCDGLTAVNITDVAAWCNLYFKYPSNNPLYYAHHLFLNGQVVKDLVIPSSVTRIGKGAFEYCSDLTSVTITESVTSIGDYAFYECSGLTDVYCTAITPPYTNYNSFDNNLSNATLHVYASAVDDYKATERWSRFGNIVPLTDEEIATDILEVKEKREEGKSVADAVYNLNGRQMNGMRRGMNIVRGSDGTMRKVIVKVSSINY